ncbi:redox-sensing transcriptional repressor Rex [bacterium]|nr:redox-sensing transcriptional repressor Rex [candidate division CSSED10-310 bacterium]
MAISKKTIERLSLYRRLIHDLHYSNRSTIFSHELAAMAHCTPAQVRRDLMTADIKGSSSTGYDVATLTTGINAILLHGHIQKAALAGIGNLGRAILSYFPQRSPTVEITAAFDSDPSKIGRIIHGCRTYPIDDLASVVKDHAITIGIITTPREAAQAIADKMIAAGIRGILNFAPIPIRVSTGVETEHLDLTMSLEKLAYFSRRNS